MAHLSHGRHHIRRVRAALAHLLATPAGQLRVDRTAHVVGHLTLPVIEPSMRRGAATFLRQPACIPWQVCRKRK
eukprot:scaffold11781_cov96-Isochrysis_galbana.AAC.5